MFIIWRPNFVGGSGGFVCGEIGFLNLLEGERVKLSLHTEGGRFVRPFFMGIEFGEFSQGSVDFIES
jgi:hypothetical protein